MPKLGSFALAPTAKYPLWLFQSFDRQYFRKVQSTQPQDLILYHPMWEPSGSVANDLSPQGNNGAYTGVELLKAGIGDGRSCPFFDGTNDLNNIYSSGLNSDFDGKEGTFMIWAKMNAAAVWTDGTQRFLARVRVDNNNLFTIEKSSADDRIVFTYIAGGTTSARTILNLTDTGWFQVAMTWSKSGDVVSYFKDGVAAAADRTGLGTWAGALTSTTCNIGALWSGVANVFHGWLAHAALWKVALPAQEILRLS